MATINTNLVCDLQTAVKVKYIDGNIFSQDAQANTINVTVLDGGEPATISGTVTANIIRSDGGTVTATGGTITDNVASITLPAAAYAVPGVVSIVVKLTADTVVTTIAAVVATVYQSSTDAAVDPGTIIPSIQTLITEIETAVASIPADYSSLWTSLAPAFSSSGNYVAGQYVTYNGGLYRFTTTHSGSWSSGDVVAVNLGDDVTALKSASYLNRATLTSDDDLDDITEPGVYAIANNNYPNHYPFTTVGGRLLVVKSTNKSTKTFMWQVIVSGQNNMKFRSTVNGETWSEWKTVASMDDLITDKSLSESDKPADSKAVGDRFDSIKADFAEISEKFKTSIPSTDWTVIQCNIQTATKKIVSNSNARVLYASIKPGTVYEVTKTLGNRFQVGFSTILPADGVVLNSCTESVATGDFILRSGNADAYIVVYYYNSVVDASTTPSTIKGSITIDEIIYTADDDVARKIVDISLSEMDWINAYIWSEDDQIGTLERKRKGDIVANDKRYGTTRLYYIHAGSTISCDTGYRFAVYRYNDKLQYAERELQQTSYTFTQSAWYAIVIRTDPETDFVENEIPVSTVLAHFTSNIRTTFDKLHTAYVELADYTTHDGITDDTISINRALSMLGAKDVLVNPFTYSITDRITLPSGLYLHGCGESSKIKLADTFDLTGIIWRPDYDIYNKYKYPMMYSGTDSQGIVLENFLLEGSDTFVDEGQIGICICGSNHLLENMIVRSINYFPEEFTDQRLTNSHGYGVFCFHAENVVIKGGSFYNCGYEDIGNEYATNITINGTFCGESNRTCIQAHRSCKDIHITNNRLENIVTLGQATITVHGQGGHEISGLVIVGNTIKGGKITFVGAREHEVIICGNTFICIEANEMIVTRTDIAEIRNYNFNIANNILLTDTAKVILYCDYATVSNNIIKSNRSGDPVVTMRGGGCVANGNVFSGTNNTVDITTVEPIN